MPILLTVAGWDPAQPLDEWIADRLAADNRGLARPVQAANGTTRSLAREMVAGGKILPILDGLDEMDSAHHAAALTGVTAAGRPFVLSCRTVPYEYVVADHGPLAATPVIEIQPLNPAEVAQYLLDGTDQPHPRWDPVVTHLTSATMTPLTRALSTPLMAWLARAVYRHRDTDPTQLLTAAWATTQLGIEQHLLDQLIPAVYTTATGGHPACGHASADKIRHHLRYLAERLHTLHTYDLAWWQLHQAFPRILSTSPARLTPARLTANQSRARLMFRLTAGLAAGFVLGLAAMPLGGLAAGLTVGAATGLLGGLTVALIRPAQDGQKAVTPHVLLAEDRIACLAVGLTLGITVGLVGGIASAFGGGFGDGLAAGFVLGPMFGLAGVVTGPWGRFCLVRLLLAAYGHTPLRLMAFLREAHDRGVLRQAGGVYQFRHNRLQDHLANPHTVV